MARRKLSKSPQAVWSRKMKAAGKCPRCSKKRRNYKQLCDRCTVLFSIYIKAWRKRKAQEAKEAAQAARDKALAEIMETKNDYPTTDGSGSQPS